MKVLMTLIFNRVILQGYEGGTNYKGMLLNRIPKKCHK